MDLLEEGPELRYVKSRRAVAVHAEAAASHLAAEGKALQIEKAPCPLQIGQRVGIGRGQPLELAARCDLEFERFHELRIVPLQDAEQGCDVARDVVDDLPPGRPPPPEENPAHADERLGIGLVRDRFDAPRELLAEPALAADIRRGRPNGRDRAKAIVVVHFSKLNELTTRTRVP